MHISIEKAKQCDGFMLDNELIWLASAAAYHTLIIEVGSWHGRSTRALADNTPGQVYAVDHFNGSAAEQDTHGSAGLMKGDHAFITFCRNNIDHLQHGAVIPFRGDSQNMAALFHDCGIKADMIFIDAGHTTEEVINDIMTWKKLLTEDGLFCGHDYGRFGVTQAVDSMTFRKQIVSGTALWFCGKKDIRDLPEAVKPKS